MRVIVGDYEVEVKAKIHGLSERMNKKDTLYFLNMISAALYGDADSLRTKGYNFLAEDSLKKARELSGMLREIGFYDEIEKNA